MSSIELVDLLASYPSADTEGFQALISAKREFCELASSPRERAPGQRGEYFRHQALVKRFLSEYDELFLIHETGTGKSCTVSAFTEWADEQHQRFLSGDRTAKGGNIREVIVLVRGLTQLKEFKRQLACVCSKPGKYDKPSPEEEGREVDEAHAKGNVTRRIKRWYRITTYISFANKIARDYPSAADNGRLQADYSDRVIWVDEAHNLRIDSIIAQNIRQKQMVYINIWRVFHLMQRSKKIISTATPMVNDVREIAPLLNLLLPIDRQLASTERETLVTPELFPEVSLYAPTVLDFETVTLDEIEPFFRGKISYVRSLDTGAIPHEKGYIFEEEYEVNGVVYQAKRVLQPSVMSPFQQEAYERAVVISGQERSLFGAERQASNFVFPDGYWGTGITEEESERRKVERKRRKEIRRTAPTLPARSEEGRAPLPSRRVPPGRRERAPRPPEPESREHLRAFQRYVIPEGDFYRASDELLPYLQDPNLLAQLACKFGAIVSIVDSTPGNAFVYIEFVEGSGAIVLALCFEAAGYSRFTERSSIFASKSRSGAKPYCISGSAEAQGRRLRPEFATPKKRYALLTPSAIAQFSSMMEAMNSYENRHGDIIKVLISSPVGRDGINVNNVTNIHLVSSEWTQSGIYQAVSRGLRATSHQDLIREEEERLRELGEDPSAATVTVDIYKHAAVILDENDQPIPTVDTYMYSVAESKDRSIRRILRMMKQCSIDCQIHRERNIRPEVDIPGTSTCDYGECDYPCYSPPVPCDDYSTYDVLYAQGVINDATTALREVFSVLSSASLGDLSSLLTEFRPKYILLALEEIITRKLPVTDRFGYVAYMRESGGNFYLDRSFPLHLGEGNIANSLYSSQIIGVEETDLDTIVNRSERQDQSQILAEIRRTDPSSPAFSSALERLSLESEARLVEEAILSDLRGERPPYVEAVLADFSTMIYTFHEPITAIAQTREAAIRRKRGKGKKADPNVRRRTNKINVGALEGTLPRDTNTEIVYIHTVYTQVESRTAYAVTARQNKAEGRLRLLKPSEGQWRDCDAYELPVYNALIQIEIANIARPYAEAGIYGLIPSDRKFRIVNKLTESSKARDDARNINKGKQCSFWGKANLVDVMWEIGVPLPTVRINIPTAQQMAKELTAMGVNATPQEMAEWDQERLSYYYSWFRATKPIGRLTIKNDICPIIQEYMREHNLILEI